MKTFLALALILAGMVSYFVLAISLGIDQAVPWPHFLVMLAGCGALVASLRRSPGWKRGLALAVGVVLTLFFFWYTLDYSAYQAREHRIGVGDTVTEIVELELKNHDGAPRPVLVNGARATLLVFYRGYW